MELASSSSEESGFSRIALRRSASTLGQISAKYGDVIVKDPDFTSKLESALKVASYLIPGRFGGSWELSELAYCISNLYSLLNDYIIAKRCPAACKISKSPKSQQSLLWILSLLDCVEVSVEMMTQRFAGEPAKWGVVILMQFFRALIRSLLVFHHMYGLTCSPAVPPPDRKAAQTLHVEVVDGEMQPQAWTAPRTGKVIRSIHADNSVPYSQLQHHVVPPSPPASPSADSAHFVQRKKMLALKQLIAEALYISRPLLHVFSMFIFNQKSWKPWLLALATDIVSLQLLGAPTSFPQSSERSEVMRRRALLLLYLLRSPFYNKHTKSILFQILKALANKLPLVRLVIDPILEYLPVWQQTYSYIWMT